MSFKEINALALTLVISFALVTIYIIVLAFLSALASSSGWFVFLLAFWFLAGLYGLVIAIWSLIEWSVNI